MSKQKKKTLTPREIRKMEDDIGYKMQVLLFAYLMDELDYDAERIKAVKDALDRYLESIDQHLITVHDVEKIIYDHTELEMVKQ